MSFQTSTPPILLEYDPPTLQYDSTNDHILLSTDYEEYEVSKPGIFVFDSKMNLIKQYPYESSLTPEDNGNALDTNKNILYIFGGSSEQFASLNLATSEWNIFAKPKLPIGGRPEACFISSLNELHIISAAGFHTKFDTMTQQFIKINSNFMGKSGQCNRVMYIPHKKQLIVLPVAFSDELFCCDIYKNQTHYEWYPSNIDVTDIPIDEQLGCTLLFDTIILCINFYTGDILFLDLMFDEWYESEVKYATQSDWTNMIMTKDNTLHCTSFTKHCRQIALNSILPQGLAQKYSILIMAFIRHMNPDIQMPTELICLISKFFSMLL